MLFSKAYFKINIVSTLFQIIYCIYSNNYILIHGHFHIGLIIIPRLPYWPETQSRANMSRGVITRLIWKCPCIKQFITYFRHLQKRHPYWPETKSRPIWMEQEMITLSMRLPSLPVYLADSILNGTGNVDPFKTCSHFRFILWTIFWMKQNMLTLSRRLLSLSVYFVDNILNETEYADPFEAPTLTSGLFCRQYSAWNRKCRPFRGTLSHFRLKIWRDEPPKKPRCEIWRIHKTPVVYNDYNDIVIVL